MADLKSVPWKLTRHPQEHIYAGAKKGWLDRVNRNAVNTWGRATVGSVEEDVTAAENEYALVSSDVDVETAASASSDSTVADDDSPAAEVTDDAAESDGSTLSGSTSRQGDGDGDNSSDEAGAASPSVESGDDPDKPSDKV